MEKRRCTVVIKEDDSVVCIAEDGTEYPIEESLGDMVVVITALEGGDGQPFPSSYVFKFDFQAPTKENVEKFIKYIENYSAIMDSAKLVAEKV